MVNTKVFSPCKSSLVGCSERYSLIVVLGVFSPFNISFERRTSTSSTKDMVYYNVITLFQV